MKRIYSFFISLLLLIIASSQINLFAQGYQPTTAWPYLNERFQPGAMIYSDSVKTEGLFNIHLSENFLQMVKNDQRVYRMIDNNVKKVIIGNKEYRFVNHKLMRLVYAPSANQNNDFIAELESVDWDSMFKLGAAYNVDLNTNRSLIMRTLNIGGLDNPVLSQLESTKTDGTPLDLESHYYMVFNGNAVDANMKGTKQLVPKEKRKQYENFVKSHKINWKNTDSLKEVLEYLEDLLK